jgi:poly(3-hydroxybutyrate) depolymerase
MGILNKVKGKYAVQDSRVYVTGISAGGAMASIMAACYSDVFAAVMVHSGGMYKGAIGMVTAADSCSTAVPSTRKCGARMPGAAPARRAG